MTDAILKALSMAFAMGWQILWPLIGLHALRHCASGSVAQRDAPPPSRRPPTVDRHRARPRRRFLLVLLRCGGGLALAADHV